MLLQQQWSGASTACVSPPIWQLEPLVPREEGKNKFKSTKNCVTVLAIRKHKGHVVFGLFAVHVTAHLLSSKEKKQVDLQNMGRNIEVFWENCLDYCLFLERKLGGGWTTLLKMKAEVGSSSPLLWGGTSQLHVLAATLLLSRNQIRITASNPHLIKLAINKLQFTLNIL